MVKGMERFGLDGTDMDMIRRGDMLGPKTGGKVYQALISLGVDEIDGRVEILEQSETTDGGTALTLRQYDQETYAVVYFPTSPPPEPVGWRYRCVIEGGDVEYWSDWIVLSHNPSAELAGSKFQVEALRPVAAWLCPE